MPQSSTTTKKNTKSTPVEPSPVEEQPKSVENKQPKSQVKLTGGQPAHQPQPTPQPKAKAKLTKEQPSTEQVVDKPLKGGKKNVKEETSGEQVLPKAKAKVKKEPGQGKLKKSKDEQKGGNDDDEMDKRIRSFKVKLPGKEDYEGRFTGLTPYQAANKALSKYFRENKEPDEEVSFSIIESTRKSDKHTYTYVGKRYKLDVPVVYKIQDANGESREIVKNYKNLLKKVKKSEQ